MKIDVVIPTLNAEKPCLKECLDSIYREIPVCHLIIVDGGSKDATLNIASSYANVIILKASNLGKQRQIGIRNVDTDWFAFIDSDMTLNPGWFNAMFKYVRPEVGCIQGLYSETRYGDKYRRAMMRLAKAFHRELKIAIGGGNNLLKTKFVRDIEIPDTLAGEDFFIRHFIEDGGYKYVITNEVTALHHRVFTSITLAYERIFCACQLGQYTFRGLLWHFITSLLLALYACVIEKDLRILTSELKMKLWSLVGGLKYYILKANRASKSIMRTHT